MTDKSSSGAYHTSPSNLVRIRPLVRAWSARTAASIRRQTAGSAELWSARSLGLATEVRNTLGGSRRPFQPAQRPVHLLVLPVFDGHRAIPGTVVHPASPQAHGRPIRVIGLPTTLPAPGSGNRPPATTRRANPGNRPNPPNLALGTRPSNGEPITLPANPGNRPNQNPSVGPSTNKARGYKPPQTSNTGTSPPLVRCVFRIRGRTRSERTRESKPGCQGRRQRRRVSPSFTICER
jgi:hypothetical protein